MTDLPTARATERAGFLCVLVWCKAYRHQAPADLPAIVEAGRGDVPTRSALSLHALRSRLTDHVTMAKDALGVPWRDDKSRRFPRCHRR